VIGSIVGKTRWLIHGRSTTAAVVQTTVLQLGALVAYFANGLLTARLLGPAGRGELAAILLIPSLMGFLSTLGVPAALLYHLKRDAESGPRLIGAAIILCMALGTVGFIAGYEIVPYALRQYTPRDVEIARLVMFVAPLSLLTYIGTSVFESAGNFWYGSLTRFLPPLVTLGSLCAFWAAGRLDVATAAVSYALPSLPIPIKMLADVVRRSHPIFFPVMRSTYQQLFSYGLRSFGLDVLKTIGQQIDQVLVVAFLSPTAMGLYAVALAISRLFLQIFQASVLRVLFPRIAARPIEEVTFAVGRATRITALLSTPLCAGVFILAPLVLRFTYGGKFTDASGVLRVLAIEALFGGSTWILAQAFLALGKPGILTALQALGLALSLPLMLVCIPRFGLIGAGYALLASTIARFAIVLASFPLLLHTKPPSLLLTLGDIKSLQLRFREKSDPVSDPTASL
jgi:antigen flippase